MEVRRADEARAGVSATATEAGVPRWTGTGVPLGFFVGSPILSYTRTRATSGKVSSVGELGCPRGRVPSAISSREVVPQSGPRGR